MNIAFKEIVKAWKLSNIIKFEHASVTFNDIFRVYSNIYDRSVVLKIGPKEVIDRELIALRYFQGCFCVTLLTFDQETLPDKTAILLELVQPGTDIKTLYLQNKEDNALQIFINLMKNVHQQSLDDQELIKYQHVQTIEHRLHFLDTFLSKNEKLQILLPQAIALKNELIKTQDEPYFLHGDLHHENILQSSDRYVMIDPQGIIGELCYEVGAFMRNPIFTLLEHPDLEKLLEFRARQLSKHLNFEYERIIDWSFVQSVLGACYYEEDHQDESDVKARDYFINLAEVLLKLR